MGQFLINGLIAGFTYGLIALSFSMIYNSVRFFDFSHGAVLTCGAYFAYWGCAQLNWPLWVSILITLILCAFMGMALDATIYRPLRHRGATRLVLLLASLGIYTVLQNLVAMIFGNGTKHIDALDVARGIPFLSARVSLSQVYIVMTSIVCFLLVHFIFKRTKFGRTLNALRSDVELAQVDGVDTDRITSGAFGLGSAIVGLAAIVIALDVDINPEMGLNPVMMAMVAMIIGGSRKPAGTLAGGLLLGLVQHLAISRIGSEWQETIAFLTLLIFLLIRPSGIWGIPSDRLRV